MGRHGAPRGEVKMCVLRLCAVSWEVLACDHTLRPHFRSRFGFTRRSAGTLVLTVASRGELLWELSVCLSSVQSQTDSRDVPFFLFFLSIVPSPAAATLFARLRK